MPCNGCKEKTARIKTEREQWDAKAMAMISEAIAIVNKANPELAKRLMALNGELNEITAKEREIIVST